MATLRALTLSTLSLTLFACESNVADDGQGGGGGGGGTACDLDPPGENFTFTIRNVGQQHLRLAYGCGRTLPIVVEVGGEPVGISPGQGDSCEVSCEDVYAGNSNSGCSDCGPGSGVALAPGEEELIVWDRRTYAAHMAPASCSGHDDGNSCALGSLLDAQAASQGTLTYCINDALNPDEVDGYCGGADAQAKSFQLDLAQSGATIELE